MSFDYQNYGAFKQEGAQNAESAAARIARRLGLGNRYLRFLASARKDAAVLEIGCGDGSFLKALLGAGFQQVLGLEPSTTYQNRVDDRLIVRTFANEHLATCPAASLGTVVALDVFEHIALHDLRALFGQIEDKLIPGGLLVFRVPNMASALALPNFYGDLSHVTAMSSTSVRQLVFGSGLEVQGLYAEPLGYPRSLLDLAGIAAWHIYRSLHALVLRAFGIRGTVLTPNLVCVLRKPGAT